MEAAWQVLQAGATRKMAAATEQCHALEERRLQFGEIAARLPDLDQKLERALEGEAGVQLPLPHPEPEALPSDAACLFDSPPACLIACLRH